MKPKDDIARFAALDSDGDCGRIGIEICRQAHQLGCDRIRTRRNILPEKPASAVGGAHRLFVQAKGQWLRVGLVIEQDRTANHSRAGRPEVEVAPNLDTEHRAVRAIGAERKRRPDQKPCLPLLVDLIAKRDLQPGRTPAERRRHIRLDIPAATEDVIASHAKDILPVHATLPEQGPAQTKRGSCAGERDQRTREYARDRLGLPAAVGNASPPLHGQHLPMHGQKDPRPRLPIPAVVLAQGEVIDMQEAAAQPLCQPQQ